MADPFSIATGCVALVGTAGKASVAISTFIRLAHESRNDLHRLETEIFSLQKVLELVAEEISNGQDVPSVVDEQIRGILANCGVILDDIVDLVKKLSEKRAATRGFCWAFKDKEDVDKLRVSLEGHKTALNLAVDLILMAIAKSVKADTAQILVDTTTIQQQNDQILANVEVVAASLPANNAELLEQLQALMARLPVETPVNFILQRYLEQLTSTFSETDCATDRCASEVTWKDPIDSHNLENTSRVQASRSQQPPESSITPEEDISSSEIVQTKSSDTNGKGKDEAGDSHEGDKAGCYGTQAGDSTLPLNTRAPNTLPALSPVDEPKSHNANIAYSTDDGLPRGRDAGCDLSRRPARRRPASHPHDSSSCRGSGFDTSASVPASPPRSMPGGIARTRPSSAGRPSSTTSNSQALAVSRPPATAGSQTVAVSRPPATAAPQTVADSWPLSAAVSQGLAVSRPSSTARSQVVLRLTHKELGHQDRAQSGGPSKSTAGKQSINQAERGSQENIKKKTMASSTQVQQNRESLAAETSKKHPVEKDQQSPRKLSPLSRLLKSVHIPHPGQVAALERAATEGAADEFVKLVQVGANVNWCINDGSTPLIESVRRGHLEAVKTLVKLGADVNLGNSSGTALHAAVRYGRGDIVCLLLDAGSHVNASIHSYRSANDGETPLMVAVSAKKHAIAKLLVSRGANFLRRRADGRTAIHLAIISYDLPMVRYLRGLGLSVNAADGQGTTALHLAAAKGSITACKLLVQLGADARLRDNKGYSVVQYASNSPDVTDGLIRYLLDCRSSRGYRAGGEGSTSLSDARVAATAVA